MKNVLLTIVLIALLIAAGYGVYNFYLVYNQNGSANVKNTAPSNFVANINNQVSESPASETYKFDVQPPADYTQEQNQNVNANINTNVLPADSHKVITQKIEGTAKVAQFITLSSPSDNTHVVSPIQLNGQAKKGITKVFIKIINLKDQELVNLSADVKPVAGSDWGDFKAKVAYEFTQTKEGYLEVYSAGADGAQENLVKLHLFFD